MFWIIKILDNKGFGVVCGVWCVCVKVVNFNFVIFIQANLLSSNSNIWMANVNRIGYSKKDYARDNPQPSFL
jgi:hypothetical protein